MYEGMTIRLGYDEKHTMKINKITLKNQTATVIVNFNDQSEIDFDLNDKDLIPIVNDADEEYKNPCDNW